MKRSNTGAGMSETATNFIKDVFGPVTESPVYICSLANDRGDETEPPERHVATRDLNDVARFIAKWDRPKRGLFFCVGTVSSGKRRAKENIQETIGLHADIDFKGIIDNRADVERKLSQLRLPPSIIVSSGNGIHAYWLFKEALVAGEHLDRIEHALRLLADLTGGDLAVCEISRLMRLPGTHNTKGGAWVTVEIVAGSGARYELDDLEEWLSETSPVILRKERPDQTPADNPFLVAAQRLGFKPSIDVEKRLQTMSYMGAGDASVHSTQLAVTASLLNSGVEQAEVVQTVLDATRAAAGAYGARWNWRREERAIERMCVDWLRKHPVATPRSLSAAATTQATNVLQTARERELAVNGAGEKAAVVNLAERRAAKTRKKKDDATAPAFVVADGVIESVRTSGQDIMLSEGEVWIYADGIWHIMTPADQQWLLTLIQEGFEAINEPAKNAALTASWKRLIEHPQLFKRVVPWADGDVIVCQNGVVDITTREFHQHSPKWFARRKIGAAYRPGEACPQFQKLLGSMFSDRAEAAGYIATIQSFMGAALAVNHLSREERKALLLVGPSRTGKTELSRIIRLLIGDPIATPSVAEISERFGLSSLYEAAAWIRDDAINEGDDLDPQRFKTIVTGEPIDIERKHKPAVPGVELSIPVLLTTNALPKARDKSDAIFNRSLILEMTNVVSEAEAHGLRQKMGVGRGDTIGSHIWKSEAAGVLNWALEGLERLLKKGSYELPESVRNAIQRFKDDNNPVGEWARVAVTKAPYSKVSRHDLMCAYHGWQREQDGDEARAMGARAFFPRLRAVIPGLNEQQDHSGRRFITGLRLTDEGVQLWDLHTQNPLKGGQKGVALTKAEVNKIIQEEVENDPSKPRF